MALKKKPVTGMKDMLPREMEIRDYLIGLIKETYKTYGFCSIETPCVEHIENLCSKQGGDNEKLIFKILKRGRKVKIDEAKEENDLVDGGLRYDLTVPLARYYSNHANELPFSVLKHFRLEVYGEQTAARKTFTPVCTVRYRYIRRGF